MFKDGKIFVSKDNVLELHHAIFSLLNQFSKDKIERQMDDIFQKCLVDMDIFEEEEGPITLKDFMERYLMPGLESVLIEKILLPFLFK